MQLLIDVFAILEPSFGPCSSKLYDLREDCSVYISFVLLDGQHASCFASCLSTKISESAGQNLQQTQLQQSITNSFTFQSWMKAISFCFFSWWVAPSFLHVQWQKLHLTERLSKPCTITACLFFSLWWMCRLHRCLQAKWVFHVTVVRSRKLYELQVCFLYN